MSQLHLKSTKAVGFGFPGWPPFPIEGLKTKAYSFGFCRMGQHLTYTLYTNIPSVLVLNSCQLTVCEVQVLSWQ
jgi:hypothetical protein